MDGTIERIPDGDDRAVLAEAWCLEQWGPDETRWWGSGNLFAFRTKADRMLFKLAQGGG